MHTCLFLLKTPSHHLMATPSLRRLDAGSRSDDGTASRVRRADSPEAIANIAVRVITAADADFAATGGLLFSAEATGSEHRNQRDRYRGAGPCVLAEPVRAHRPARGGGAAASHWRVR